MLLALGAMLALQAETVAGLDVADLCQFVADKLTLSGAGGAPRYRYVYQARLFAAAGVHVQSDDPTSIQEKMQRFWNRHQDRLICNVVNSTVRNGHILRVAVERSNGEFINDVARRWRVDLNYRDRRDGGTVLDYLDAQLALARGSPREATLNRYRQILEAAGGRHARDLR